MYRFPIGTNLRHALSATCLALSLVVPAGCEQAGGTDPQATGVAPQVQDSAGVRIVSYARFPADLPRWRLPDSPAVRIGAVEGAGPDVFGRVAGVVSLSDGTIVVAGGQARELRAFAASGEHLWTAGRRGDGPGEFGTLGPVLPGPADSLLVVDRNRVSVFSRDGVYARQVTLPAGEALAAGLADTTRLTGVPSVAGASGAGHLVVSAIVALPPQEDGRYRNDRLHALLDLSARPVRRIAVFPGAESAKTSISGVTPDGTPFNSTVHATLPVSRTTQLATAAGRVVIGDQARFALYLYGNADGPETIVRVAAPPVLLDRARYAATDGSCPSGDCWQNAALPDTLPTFGSLLLDAEGNLWVQEFVPPYEERDPEWRVIDAAGRFVARMAMPRNFTPHQIREADVVGVSTDQLEVEYVEVWPIVKED